MGGAAVHRAEENPKLCRTERANGESHIRSTASLRLTIGNFGRADVDVSTQPCPRV